MTLPVRSARSGSYIATSGFIRLSFPPESGLQSSLVDLRQVEPAKALGVGQDVDLDDPPARHGDAHDRERTTIRGAGDEPGCSVHEDRSHEGDEPLRPRERERL